jgi:thiazole synthase ThiGH ThiG subunit
MGWLLGGNELNSRLLMGTARYPSLAILQQAILAAETEVITVSIRRQTNECNGPNLFWETLKSLNVQILPNTAGCFSAKEAILTAQLARELFNTSWIKLEVMPFPKQIQFKIVASRWIEELSTESEEEFIVQLGKKPNMVSAAGIAKVHEGTLDINSESRHLRVTIILPRAWS